MGELSLTTERTIDAAQKTVFDAWLDAEMLKRFMTPGEGMTVPEAHTDAIEGGAFKIVMQAGDQQIPHTGTYRKIDPHSQIVFTWNSPFSAEDSEVTVDFAPNGSGTKVTLTHVRFPDEESRQNHLGGWATILAALEEGCS